MKEIKWAVLGCGVIANEMAVALQKNGKNIYAVGNRTHEKAAAFAEKYGIGKVYDDFHEMFTDPEVDVIYITTPHNTHLGFMKEAIANGKHILVEKSITLNSDELDEAIALAKEKGVIIGEAMTIYHMPIYKELKKILDSGRLGRVNLITMNFGSFKEYNMKNRFFNRNLAGGAMLDIGVYALSFLRWFFDSKPDQLLSQVKPAPTGVDEQAGLLLTNQEGQMASVMLSLHSKQPKRGMVSCENGFIEIMEYPRAWEAKITDASTGESEIIKAGDNADALAYELADMERAINGDASAMHLDYTKDVMDLMTSFRRTWGYTYPEEEKYNSHIKSPCPAHIRCRAGALLFTCNTLQFSFSVIPHQSALRYARSCRPLLRPAGLQQRRWRSWRKSEWRRHHHVHDFHAYFIFILR